MSRPRCRSPRHLVVTLSLVMVLLLAACGGGKEEGGAATEDEGEPVRGGSVTYGLEAETGDGWCLQEAQLAIAGIMVARSIYDTLTAPNAEGEYVPYLAESVDHDDAYEEWTISLRDGVTFHDGSDLTAEVVKNNLDAYRGQYKDAEGEAIRSPLLFIFVLDNIDTVEVTGDLEVTVTTKVPWVAFPAFLHSSGRLGMVGQAQLDDEERCDSNLIGTGPFQLERWQKGVELVAEKNPDYWQEAPDGEPYPYLDEIRFTPIPESGQAANALEAGSITMMHTSSAEDFLTLNSLAEAGAVDVRDSEDFAEVAFLQLNTSKPPLDDVRIRKAMALAIDRQDYKEVRNRGLFTMASGPYAPGAVGYLEDAGYPEGPKVEEAKALVAEYVAEKGPLPKITHQDTPDAGARDTAVYYQQAFKAVGITIDLVTVQQDKQIDNAINGDYDLTGFRNYPGGDPDELYIWFSSTSPANFSRIDDPEIDRLLAEGRSEPDPQKRAGIYEDIDRRFGSEVYSLWANWVTWRVASVPEVHGYTLDTLPKLPDGSEPFTGLATGHPVQGLWVEQ